MKIEKILKSTTALSINKRILFNIIYIQTVLHDGLSEILKPYDLSKEQFEVLVILRDLNSNLSNMYMIKEKMGSKTSNTTRLVDKLLLKELVTREVCMENRRKIEISITRKGLLLIEEAEPKVLAYEAKLADNLNPDEIKSLNHLLEKYQMNNYK